MRGTIWNYAASVLVCITEILLSAFGCDAAKAQVTVSGHIIDAVTGERLIGASVYVPALLTGTATDGYGFFVLAAPDSVVVVEYSYTGYVLAKATYAQSASGLAIALQPGTTLSTAEVVASRRADEIDDRVGMSTVDIPMALYDKAPVLLGEPDILKTLQLMPGVQGGTEGTAGLYVRGGSPDQNLILLDGVPVYNISHALGVFSVFNSDAVQSVTLTKGGFPARFGGRLSSVLEVETKDGSADAWRVEGAVGLISSRLTVGGPVGDKTRVLISARRTYFDAIYKPILAIQHNGRPYKDLFAASFYDANLKVRHDLNERHRLYLSAYSGGDVFETGDELTTTSNYSRYVEGTRWGNRIGALRWRYQISPRTYLNTTTSYSRYGIGYTLSSESRAASFPEGLSTRRSYISDVRDVNLKSDLAFVLNSRHTLRVGALATRHRYQPGQLAIADAVGGESTDTTYAESELGATEGAVYAEHEWTVSDALSLNYGVHASAFRSDEAFSSLQPRASMRYRLPGRVGIKASYAQMTQYVNLLTTESLSLPTDLWVPSTSTVLPQRSWQAAVGVVKQARSDIELSAEAFYKQLDNVVSYRAGESFFYFDPRRTWQSKVTQGTGTVYGLELLAQRKYGRTTGWLGYTVSYNERTFAELNGGKAFPFRYDRRHDVSAVLSYDLSDRLTVGGSWVYFTGNAYTLPQYRQYTDFAIQGAGFYEFVGYGNTAQSVARNQYRASASHRLDVSLTLTKDKKWGERAWVLGLYNAYWHKNPVYVRAKDIYLPETQTYERQFQEVSLLPIVPSVAYQFRFSL